MVRNDLARRIASQFGDADERADVWRALDLVLPTHRYLNLGYSPRFWPTLLGSSQRRLVDRVGDALADELPVRSGATVLDVGCGRGGPAVRLAERHGFRVFGVDLVPHNVARARANAASADASFLVGDAARLPVRDGSVTAATAIDAIVYVPGKRALFAELARALEPGGVVVASDLVARPGPTDEERAALDAFAEAWDMPPLPTLPQYEAAIAEAGLELGSVTDVSAHSVGRFGRWTTAYRLLTTGPGSRLLARGLRRYCLDPVRVDDQVRRAHDALASLRHVLVVAAR